MNNRGLSEDKYRLFVVLTLLILTNVICSISGKSWNVVYGQVGVDQIGLPQILHFSPADYKAQRQNWSIAQVPQTRFMYVANSKGLLEFDGQRWQTYTLPNRQIVRSIAVAGDKVYTGALQEFGYWQPNEKGHLKYHSLAYLNKDKRFKKEEIWNILPIGDAVYFHSFAFLYRYQNQQITTLPTPGNVFFAYEVNQRLFVHILEKGLYEWINEQFVLVPGSEFLGRERVRCLLPFATNELLIGTDRQLFRYDGNRFNRWETPASQFLALNHLNKAIRVNSRLFVYGSVLNGLIVTDENGRILHHLNQKQGIQNNTILALQADADGNVWVGTDNGIDALMLSSPLRHFQDKDGLLGSVYDAALYNGSIYVGTNHGVFRIKEAAQGASMELVPGSQGQVWDLMVVDHTLFCGHNDGTFILDGSAFRRISDVTGGLVLSTLAKHPDVLLQGTYTNLCLYRKVNGQWKFHATLPGDFSLTDQLFEQPDGTFWLKRKYGGTYHIALSDSLNRVKILKTIANPQDASLAEVNRQPVLCTNQKAISLTNNQPIPMLGNEGIRALFPIPGNAYLALRLNGRLAYWQPGQRIADLNQKHVQWVEGYENVVGIDDNTLLICGDDGFSLFPVSYITQGIRVSHGKPLIRQISTENFTLVHYPNQPKPNLSFAYWQNTISFELTSTQYEGEFSVQYLLEGSDKGWSSLTRENILRLGPLDPGRYELKIRSAVSSEESVLKFEIHPPWYWNRWSQLVYLLLVLAGVGLTYRFYRRRIETHQRRIHATMQKRLEEEKRRNDQTVTELKNEQLKKDVDRKSEELANSAMNLLQKNDLLETIKGELEKLRKEIGPERESPQYRSLVQLINRNLADEHSWNLFESNFNDVHEYFFKKLLESYPSLTPGDLKLAAYLRMNLSSKEIAQLLNITVRSVELKRYRLRTKLTLHTEQNLNEFLMKV